MIYDCAKCSIHACRSGKLDRLPKNCPMRAEAFQKEAFAEYEKEENHDFYVNSSCIESEGYGQWTRMQEILEFCRKMHYTKIGLAFCIGLRNEAKVVDRYYEQHGLEVVSVVCKTGAHDKETVGITDEKKVHPGQFEAMCNPIMQAKAMNAAGTQLNIILGLCVGHDSLFIKYSEAPVTTLVTKDRVLAHNPCGAIYVYDSYYKGKLQDQ